MKQTQNPERVPKQMQSIFEAIVQLTDEVCAKYLNDEYAQMATKVTAALCRKRPSPLLRGAAKPWACGIVHAVGLVNFLFDSSKTPHMKASELYQAFGVAPGTGGGKSKAVRDALGMSYFNAQWCLPSRLEDNLMVWILMVNGLPVDVRTMPREVQVMAYEKGLIPYIPADRQPG